MIAALYVATGGAYWGLDGVDPWDELRDARLYAGPHPVVAHPPCARWSRLAGQVEYRYGTKRGADGGCFAAALAAVRTFGGILEHPEGSAAWKAFGLLAPPREGGWVPAGDLIGWTCCVEQGHYGHRARKATWLYAAGVASLPDLARGESVASLQSLRKRTGSVQLMSKKERKATPLPFRDLLLSIARSVRRPCARRQFHRSAGLLRNESRVVEAGAKHAGRR